MRPVGIKYGDAVAHDHGFFQMSVWRCPPVSPNCWGGWRQDWCRIYWADLTPIVEGRSVTDRNVWWRLTVASAAIWRKITAQIATWVAMTAVTMTLVDHIWLVGLFHCLRVRYGHSLYSCWLFTIKNQCKKVFFHKINVSSAVFWQCPRTFVPSGTHLWR